MAHTSNHYDKFGDPSPVQPQVQALKQAQGYASVCHAIPRHSPEVIAGRGADSAVAGLSRILHSGGISLVQYQYRSTLQVVTAHEAMASKEGA